MGALKMGKKEEINPPPISEKIKDLRKDIHSLVISFPDSYLNESHLVRDSRQSLLESRMWLGNVLDKISGIGPYEASLTKRRNGNKKTFSEDADKGSFLFDDIPAPTSKVGFCDLFRKLCREQQDVAEVLYGEFCVTFFYKTWGSMYMEQAVLCLVEARNYLGLELGSLRDKRKDESKSS